MNKFLVSILFLWAGSVCAQTHTLICFEPWFSYLRDGIKRVEGRKNSPKHQHIEVGDILEFINEQQETFLARVTEICRYASLEAYLRDVGYQNAVPGVESFEKAVEVYLQFSTPEEIERYGFLALFVELHTDK